MYFALYCDDLHFEQLKELLKPHKFKCFNKTETLIQSLIEEEYNAVIVAMDGAKGMEGAMAANNVDNSLPIIWFSNEDSFAIQAFRIGAIYFSLLPITEEKLLSAIKKCQLT